jgi:hypothetical protein
MTALEMQTAFEIETNKIDAILKPLSSDTFYWLNQATTKFVKTRYSGFNPKKESFEETQKRTDDLRTLVKEITINTTSGAGSKPNGWVATIPVDYLFTVGEEVDIQYIKNLSTITTRVAVLEVTSDRYTEELKNVFSEYRLHDGWANPMRLYAYTYVELISDGTYDIPRYYLRYISLPTAISLPANNSNLPEHTHSEIVKLAVSMYLENKKEPRYQSYNNEINTME